MTATSIRIVPGLALPFFPMRPAEGRTLSTPAKAVELMEEFLAKGDHLSAKLNGDRSCVAVVARSALSAADIAFFKPLIVGDAAVLVQNRHGGRYGHKIKNLHKYAQLKPESCLDGEVWQQQFYPFEALAWGGDSYLREGPHHRSETARMICRLIQVDWLFGPLTEAYLRLHLDNLPIWEGFVRKVKGSAYVPCIAATSVSPTVTKHKWYHA